MLGAVLSMIAVWKAPETFRRDLRATSSAPTATATTTS
jgi:MHS family shikimate/dehydroshikimate transporter-like MFS transporter